MGNSPLTLCIHHVWEKQTVQVVLPAGQVIFMPHPLTVAMVLKAHPLHFLCKGSPSLLEQRLPADAKLETGEIYYLLPVLKPGFTATSNLSFQRDSARPKCRTLVEKVEYRPPSSVFEKSPSKSVAAIMPEETFKLQGDHQGPRPPAMARKYQRFETRNRGVRGKKQVIAWTPHLESISETKPVQDFTKKNINSLSLSMFANIKSLSAPALSPALHGQRTTLIHCSPLREERGTQKQKLMYSA